MARDPESSSARPNSSGRGPENPSTVGGQVNPSAPAEGNSPPSTNLAENNPTAFKPGREGGGNIHSTPASRDNRELTFRCADVGRESCNWEVRGRSEQELMPQIEQHAREHHNLSSLDESTRRHILDAIRHRSAA